MNSVVCRHLLALRFDRPQCSGDRRHRLLGLLDSGMGNRSLGFERFDAVRDQCLPLRPPRHVPWRSPRRSACSWHARGAATGFPEAWRSLPARPDTPRARRPGDRKSARRRRSDHRPAVFLAPQINEKRIVFVGLALGGEVGFGLRGLLIGVRRDFSAASMADFPARQVGVGLNAFRGPLPLLVERLQRVGKVLIAVVLSGLRLVERRLLLGAPACERVKLLDMIAQSSPAPGARRHRAPR